MQQIEKNKQSPTSILAIIVNDAINNTKKVLINNYKQII